jgi:hypothetical protein
MARSRWLRMLLLALALAAFPGMLLLPGMATGVLFLAPAIVLLASLLTGRYVGEDGVRRLAASVRRRDSRAARALRDSQARGAATARAGGDVTRLRVTLRTAASSGRHRSRIRAAQPRSRAAASDGVRPHASGRPR